MAYYGETFTFTIKMTKWLMLYKEINPFLRIIYETRQGGEEYPTYNKIKKANWTGYIFRANCQLKHVVKGKVEMSIEATGRRGRRCKQLSGGLTETRVYCKL